MNVRLSVRKMKLADRAQIPASFVLVSFALMLLGKGMKPLFSSFTSYGLIEEKLLIQIRGVYDGKLLHTLAKVAIDKSEVVKSHDPLDPEWIWHLKKNVHSY